MASAAMIKLAVEAGKSKKGRKMIGVILMVVLTIALLLVSLLSSAVSIFLGYGVSSDFQNFDATQTSLYAEVRQVYLEYVEERNAELERMADEIRRQYTDYDIVQRYDPDTGTYIREMEWYCTATVYQSWNHINSAYVYAYISCTKASQLMSSYRTEYHPSREELYEFWDSISTLSATRNPESSEDSPVYDVCNVVLSAEEIAEMFFSSEEEQMFFLQSLYMVRQYIGAEEEYGGGYMVESPNRMNIPLYYQYAPSWGSVRYGNGTISQNGCAPTCIAMVFSYLKQQNIYPNEITAWTGNRYYVAGQGSSWDIFSACANQWSVHCEYIGVSGYRIVQELEQGHPVILSMGPGTFTSGGHLIVLTGVSDEGKIYVNDPNDNAQKNHYGQEFSLSLITLEAKGGWSFY